MKYLKLEGIIINRRSLRDADRFLTIFTREYGKISVYAHSIRTVKSKRAGSLDLFSHIRFELLEKGEHKTLTSVELISSHQHNKLALTNIARLFQIGELIDGLLPEDDPHLEVYELLSTALTHLSEFETPTYLFRFKKKLLQLLGFWDTSLTEATIDPYLDSLLTRPLRAKII